MEGLSLPEKEPRSKIEFTPEEIEEARKYIQDRWAEGIRPIVTTTEKYLPVLQTGLKPHTTWIPGFDAVTGTFDKKAYTPNDARGARIALKIDIPPEQIEPRFTGPQHTFSGVVILRGPIPPESIQLISLH